MLLFWSGQLYHKFPPNSGNVSPNRRLSHNPNFLFPKCWWSYWWQSCPFHFLGAIVSIKSQELWRDWLWSVPVHLFDSVFSMHLYWEVLNSTVSFHFLGVHLDDGDVRRVWSCRPVDHRGDTAKWAYSRAGGDWWGDKPIFGHRWPPSCKRLRVTQNGFVLTSPLLSSICNLSPEYIHYAKGRTVSLKIYPVPVFIFT